MSNNGRPERGARRGERLPARVFHKVRTCARECLVEARGDRDKAIALVHERMESLVGSVLLSIAIQIAVKLIVYWITNRITEPSVVTQFGEPGTSEDDLEEWDDQ